jgi:hypothetical protein
MDAVVSEVPKVMDPAVWPAWPIVLATHRAAWSLVALSVVACAVAAFAGRRWAPAAGGGAVVLLVAGPAFAWRNGRSLQRRWLARGLRGEIVLDDVRAEFTDDGSTRCAVVGTVPVSGPSRSGAAAGDGSTVMRPPS